MPENRRWRVAGGTVVFTVVTDRGRLIFADDPRRVGSAASVRWEVVCGGQCPPSLLRNYGIAPCRRSNPIVA